MWKSRGERQVGRELSLRIRPDSRHERLDFQALQGDVLAGSKAVPCDGQLLRIGVPLRLPHFEKELWPVERGDAPGRRRPVEDSDILRNRPHVRAAVPGEAIGLRAAPAGIEPPQTVAVARDVNASIWQEMEPGDVAGELEVDGGELPPVLAAVVREINLRQRHRVRQASADPVAGTRSRLLTDEVGVLEPVQRGAVFVEGGHRSLVCDVDIGERVLHPADPDEYYLCTLSGIRIRAAVETESLAAIAHLPCRTGIR